MGVVNVADTTSKELRNKLIYQIFVRNYSEEGTFRAVESDLDRIRDLGTDIVYFLPIHPIGVRNRKGTLGSPYAIRDYRSINPEYGTIEDFKRLVSAIHAKGMKCIIDVVYNHTSPDSVLSQEHPEWFYHKKDGSFGNRVGDWSDIIDLDYNNMELWDYQIETLKYWAEIVDGFRCDVAPLVPVKFWERARVEVEQVRSGCIWLSESIEPNFIIHLRSRNITAHSDGEIYRAFDISYDYDIYNIMTDYIFGKQPLSAYAEAINRQEYIYPDNYVKLRFLENHDQTRAHFLIPDYKSLLNYTAFMFFQKGTAFLYAGQEFGVSHLPGLFDKDTVKRSPEDNLDMTGFIKNLAEIKKSEIFKDSVYSVTAVNEDTLVAVHSHSKEKAVGVFSLKGKTVHVPVDMPDGLYVDMISSKKIEVFRKSINCEGKPIILIY